MTEKREIISVDEFLRYVSRILEFHCLKVGATGVGRVEKSLWQVLRVERPHERLRLRHFALEKDNSYIVDVNWCEMD